MRHLSSKAYLTAIITCLFLLDGFVLWFTIRIDHDRMVERAKLVLQKTVISLDERVKRSCMASEAVLLTFARRVEERGIHQVISSNQEWEVFRVAAESLPDAGTLWLLDSKGNVLMDSMSYPSHKINFSDREYFFIPQRNKDIEFYISPLVKGRITKKYFFNISRRINGKNGEFLGIVMAAIETDAFTNFMRNLDIGEGSRITVFNTEGALILRQPMSDELLGKTFKHLQLFSLASETSPSGIFESPGMEGVRRLIAYRKVEGLPLIVTTGIPIDSVLKEWRAHIKNYTTMAAAVFLLLIWFSLYSYKSVKREGERTFELSEAVERLRVENIQRKQLEDTLRQSENQVRFFASQCLAAQETERRRVAGELHDSIAASLGAMRFRIERTAEEMKQGCLGPESLQDLASKVADMNIEVRRIMADLRPSILDDLGIIPAMNWFCREYQKTYSHISVEKELGILEEDVPDSLKTPIFRICQEAMNNVAKYSKASRVNLSLLKATGKILLTIWDNGQGFDLTTVKKGMGLSTMRERAQLSEGTFDIEAAIGKGTMIRVSWPIP